MSTTPFSTRLFWAALALIVLAVAWQGLTHLANTYGEGVPDLSQTPLEQHRDSLIEDAHDVATTIEQAG